MDFDTSKIGTVFESTDFRVNTQRLAAFADATNDEHPFHRTGKVAPPVFSYLPAFQAVVRARHAVSRQFGVHGEQDFALHNVVVPGMLLRSRTSVHGIQPAKTGVSIILKSTIEADGGILIAEHFFTGFIIGKTLSSTYGREAPVHRLPDNYRSQTPDHEVTLCVDANQSYRFADAARDYDGYCVSDVTAKAKGFATVLLHGMGTMALCSRVIVDKLCGQRTEKLRRLAVRFSHPLYMQPGQTLRVSVWKLDSDDRAFGFTAEDRDGNLVLNHGLAELHN